MTTSPHPSDVHRYLPIHIYHVPSQNSQNIALVKNLPTDRMKKTEYIHSEFVLGYKEK